MSAVEFVRSLRGLTSSPTLLRSVQDKSVVAQLVSSGVKFVPEMTPADVRSVAKSVSVLARAFPEGELNNYLLKQLDKRLVEWSRMPYAGHDAVAAMNALSQVVRAVHDGGPPALRPDTVVKYLHSPYWDGDHSGQQILDKCEFLSVLARLNIRPFEPLVSKLFFPPEQLEQLDTMEDRHRSRGRICGALASLGKLDLFEFPAVDALVNMLPGRVGDMTTVELANVGCVLAARGILTEKHIPEVDELIIMILKKIVRNKSQLSLASINQLGIVLDALVVAGRNIPAPVVVGCNHILASVGTLQHTKSSKAHGAVRRAVDYLGLGNFVHEELALGPFRIDIGLPELGIGIEVNGPYHYYFQSDRITAKTKLKNLILERKYGIKLVEVSHEELRSVGAEKHELIERKIRDRLGIPGGHVKLLKAELMKLAKYRKNGN